MLRGDTGMTTGMILRKRSPTETGSLSLHKAVGPPSVAIAESEVTLL